MATVLKVLAVVILLAGGYYLYVELEAVRVGAISPLGYLGRVLAVAVLALLSWIFGRRLARKQAQANDVAGTF